MTSCSASPPAIFQFDLPVADADAIAGAARLVPTGPAATLTGDPTLLQNAIGLLLSHPSFQRR